MIRVQVLLPLLLTGLVSTLVIVAQPAEAAITPPSPSGTAPTASASPAVVVAGGPDVGQAVTFEVQDFSATSDGFGFSEASLDGAVVDTGNRDFRLASDVLFAFDEATLTSRARREIARIAIKLKASGAGEQVTAVKVTGYTDAVGSDAYNLRLSKRRAQAVGKALSTRMGAGVTVTSAGRGEAGPIAKNGTAVGRKANRRVEIRAG